MSAFDPAVVAIRRPAPPSLSQGQALGRNGMDVRGIFELAAEEASG